MRHEGIANLSDILKKVPVNCREMIEVEIPSRYAVLDALRDQTPLFLPTERNVPVRAARRPEAGRAVLGQEDKRYAFDEAELKLILPPPQVIAEKPVEVMLTEAGPIPLHGFGRKDLVIVPFPKRGALVEVLTTGTNQRVLAVTLPVEAIAERIVKAVKPFAYDRIYSGWWDRVLVEDAKAAVQRSADRYIAAIR